MLMLPHAAKASNCSVFQFPHRLSDGNIRDVVLDITNRKKELERAASIQKHRLSTNFPLENCASLESIYLPARTVSGDFYQLYRINDHQVFGLLGDVSGKGIKHLEEEYTAAYCFKFDFKLKEAVVAGAGINRFYYSPSGDKWIEKIVKGPFLGMFEDSIFEMQVMNFNSGDRFYFHTDGLDFMFDDISIMDECMEKETLKDLKSFINNILQKGTINDDSTWLGIEIK